MIPYSNKELIRMKALENLIWRSEHAEELGLAPICKDDWVEGQRPKEHWDKPWYTAEERINLLSIKYDGYVDKKYKLIKR